jgi:formate-dependent phosphoribosylglycinamide formyltransferase (GAR transformylase)
MAGEMKVHTRQMHAMSIKLTDEQKKAIQTFWSETGGVGTVGIEVDVVGDRISPASIQVGTAK